MSMPSMFPFVWFRPSATYFRWVPGPNTQVSRGPWLVDARIIACAVSLPRYEPMREFPTLFYTFAALPLTAEGVLAFANTYGCLGIAEKLPTEIDEGPAEGESLWDWDQEIRELRGTLAVWQALKVHTDPVAALSPYVTVTQEADRNAKPYHIASAQEAAALTATLRAGGDWYCTVRSEGDRALAPYRPSSPLEDVAMVMRAAAMEFVQRGINWKLLEHTHAGLAYLPDRGDTHPRIRIIPRHLLGALWLQFARAVDGNKDYGQCLTCENRFEISLQETGYRTNRSYCSDACRSKAYRERQLRAHQLAAQGMAIEAIAEALETTTPKIQGWLAKTRPALEPSAVPRRRGRPRKQLPAGARS
jgi:hypothetical protein